MGTVGAQKCWVIWPGGRLHREGLTWAEAIGSEKSSWLSVVFGRVKIQAIHWYTVMCCGLTSPWTRKPEPSCRGTEVEDTKLSGCLPCLEIPDINLERGSCSLLLGWDFLPYILVMMSPDQAAQVLTTLRKSETGIWEEPSPQGPCWPPILIFTDSGSLGFADIYQLGCQCLHLGVQSLITSIALHSTSWTIEGCWCQDSKWDSDKQFLWSLPGRSINCFVNEKGCLEPWALQIYELTVPPTVISGLPAFGGWGRGEWLFILQITFLL